MNRFSTYILLVLIFLGLSKSFSPAEQQLLYVENEFAFQKQFQGAPLSIILVDYFKAGFLIKTYFHRYKIVHGFKSPDFVTARVSKKFWEKNKEHLGLSLFRRREIDNHESRLPLPPGSLFIGDPSFGHWEDDSKSKNKYWVFHRAYKNFPKYLSWENFKPDFSFYQSLNMSIAQEKVFWGNNREFGFDGVITRKAFATAQAFTPVERIHFRELLNRFVSSPWKFERKKHE